MPRKERDLPMPPSEDGAEGGPRKALWRARGGSGTPLCVLLISQEAPRVPQPP